jgi:hypothetical protein
MFIDNPAQIVSERNTERMKDNTASRKQRSQGISNKAVAKMRGK